MSSDWESFHGRPSELCPKITQYVNWLNGDSDTCHHIAVLFWLTWNKEHDPSSKGAVEPLESREVGKGEDSCDNTSKAWHGGEDHESTSGIPVSWGGAKQGREHTVKICAGRSTTSTIITIILHHNVMTTDIFLIVPMHCWTHTAVIFNTTVHRQRVLKQRTYTYIKWNLHETGHVEQRS